MKLQISLSTALVRHSACHSESNWFAFRGQDLCRIGTPRTVHVFHASRILIQERQIETPMK
jgi:hypothetical protein